ncbi:MULTISPECIES: flagellar basal body rod protein FlgC [unclassified Cryobacterium]|uniref:flagellar basal body rod protein FlgC n=1 Tax=unclassified Cryobacterium TaxID=2649013 RepID=UPI002AB3C054|nr:MULTISPECIES: flagellar basal body rod C-terminal domain-containing protein [unclassified Cryobacterium]MDY7543557.1 flagellar basal body rod C-terminal domain-containing protein [Cryobacterium sp. 5B3]MEA9999168.1 flagellar basal body rod C-terminal domain-containing protein [Cryobacterium sp. RTS3]MEB0266183.1 flagellar basal body rod C-terminal domain-containing protein [Cryobacterium sp. 10I5]MEB0273085.1 flagellar basal body rod C-terminal domain-containing protein [Cryobacterium sp. 5B
MSLDAIGIAGSGLTLHRKWLDAIADNIANVNTVTPTSGNAFQARYIVAQAGVGVNGVEVAGTAQGSATGILVSDPTNPLADAAGYVRHPDIDLGEQMGDLIMAQRGYQANAAVVDRAKTTYEAALQIGRA